MTESYAVRWAMNEVSQMYLVRYTKWHYTTNETFTLCGRMIALGGNGHRFMPDTDDEVSKVDCKGCLKGLGKSISA